MLCVGETFGCDSCAVGTIEAGQSFTTPRAKGLQGGVRDFQGFDREASQFITRHWHSSICSWIIGHKTARYNNGQAREEKGEGGREGGWGALPPPPLPPLQRNVKSTTSFNLLSKTWPRR
jgi:hypothetical protein